MYFKKGNFNIYPIKIKIQDQYSMNCIPAKRIPY